VAWALGSAATAAVLLSAAAIVALFFRNPKRTPPLDPATLLSPADGTVVAIKENVTSPRLDDAGLTRISIFMSIFNVHVNRAPARAVVEKITPMPGGYLDAREEHASQQNSRVSLVLNSDDAGRFEVVQVAGKVARRISCWVREGEGLNQGERFGIIHFGSRLDVCLPPGFTPRVNVGQAVKAGLTVIAARNGTQAPVEH
jgi:phosphatidylserine decarboxylase